MATRTPQAPRIIVRGTGVRYPDEVLDVPELVANEQPRLLFRNHIVAALGVETVHNAGPDDTGASLASEAARRALKDARMRASELDLITSVSCTIPDVDVWSMPAKIAQHLDAGDVECLGIGEAACAGAYAAMRTLLPVMRDHDGPSRVLLAAACVMPGRRFFSPSTVFGDGAGAVILEKVGRSKKKAPTIVRSDLYSYPEYIDAFGPSAGLTRLRAEGRLEPEAWTFEIRDRRSYDKLCLYNYGLGAQALRTSLERAGWPPDSLSRLVPDNVSITLGPAIATKAGVPLSRVRNANCATRGHAFAADLFSNLHTVLDDDTLKRGDRIAMLGVGLGLHWAVLLVEV